MRVRGGIPGGRGATASALPPSRGVMHLAGKLEYSMARQLGVHSTYLIRSESTLDNFCSESHSRNYEMFLSSLEIGESSLGTREGFRKTSHRIIPFILLFCLYHGPKLEKVDNSRHY